MGRLAFTQMLVSPNGSDTGCADRVWNEPRRFWNETLFRPRPLFVPLCPLLLTTLFFPLGSLALYAAGQSLS